MSDWKKDPRLKKNGPGKKSRSSQSFRSVLNRTPGPQMLSLLLSFQAEAGEERHPLFLTRRQMSSSPF